MRRNSALILLCFLEFVFCDLSDIGCGRNWVPFGEEKCYRIVQKTATWEDGVGNCDTIDKDRNATLAMIKSKEEQDFIEDYLFNQKHVLENVWIGAKRNNENREFRWVDGSKLEYKHFKKGEPDNTKNKNCLQFIANRDLLALKDEASLGKWSNTECQRHNFNVLCQKTQDITFTKLAEIVFELRKKYEKEKKELKDIIAEMQTKESDLQDRIEELEKNETSCRDELREINEEMSSMKSDMKKSSSAITNLQHGEENLNESISELKDSEKELKIDINGIKNNENFLKKEVSSLKEELAEKIIVQAAPLNTIHVQYPRELEPSEVWNCSGIGVWKDISSQYAGHFFRVLGRNSAAWGSIQQPSSPYLKTLIKWSCGGEGAGCTNGPKEEIQAQLGGWSDGYLHISHNSDSELDFVHSNDEVKPINMAIKIWKCSEA